MKPIDLSADKKEIHAGSEQNDKSSITNSNAPNTADAKATLWSRYSWFGFRKTRADRGLFITAHRLQSGEAAPKQDLAVIAVQPAKKEQSEAVNNWEDEGGTTAAAQPAKVKLPGSAH